MNKQELANRLSAVFWLRGRFILRSGKESDLYFDKYLFEGNPHLLRAVADFAAQLIPPEIEVLAGLELGGVPVATALSLATNLPQVLVRKQPKTYGTQKLAEGSSFSGRRVLVVEDVISTGGQVIASAEELQALGALVDTVLCVVDRRTEVERQGGDLASHNIRVIPVFTIEELVK